MLHSGSPIIDRKMTIAVENDSKSFPLFRGKHPYWIMPVKLYLFESFQLERGRI
jgi:hypothetical protein